MRDDARDDRAENGEEGRERKGSATFPLENAFVPSCFNESRKKFDAASARLLFDGGAKSRLPLKNECIACTPKKSVGKRGRKM